MPENSIKFAFFGTPEVASETLEILKQSGFLPTLIVTAPDKPVGRKQIMTPPPVKVWAIENNIPLLQPENLGELKIILETSSQNDGSRKAILQQENTRGSQNNFQFDIFVVVAYGKIFPEWLINTPSSGTLNIHYSLLPKYRGAAPVQNAILNGDTETGVTIQKMVRELDAGPIIAQEKVEILPDEKNPELLLRLIKIGGELLVKTLPLYLENLPAGRQVKYETEQDHSKVTFAPKIKKEDGLIDLSDDPFKNYNKFRAFYDWPRVYFMKDGKRIIISDAEISAQGGFVIKKVIPEGKNEMPYSESI